MVNSWLKTRDVDQIRVDRRLFWSLSLSTTTTESTVHLANFLVERPDSSSLVPAPEVNVN